VASLWLVYGQGDVHSVEPKQRDIDDPNAVEVDKQMSKQAFLIISLEEYVILVETHETLCWRNIYKTSLVKGG